MPAPEMGLPKQLSGGVQGRAQYPSSVSFHFLPLLPARKTEFSVLTEAVSPASWYTVASGETLHRSCWIRRKMGARETSVHLATPWNGGMDFISGVHLWRMQPQPSWKVVLVLSGKTLQPSLDPRGGVTGLHRHCEGNGSKCHHLSAAWY